MTVEYTLEKKAEARPQSSLPLAHFRLNTKGHGHSSTVEVNGQDVSRHCRRAVLMLDAREVTVLQLELSGSGEVEGDGIVKVILDEDQAEVPLAQTVLRFLDSVDPQDLEQRVLMSGMSDGPVPAVLRALKELALQ